MPGQGQMKPEELEIERLRREVIKLKRLQKNRGQTWWSAPRK